MPIKLDVIFFPLLGHRLILIWSGAVLTNHVRARHVGSRVWAEGLGLCQQWQWVPCLVVERRAELVSYLYIHTPYRSPLHRHTPPCRATWVGLGEKVLQPACGSSVLECELGIGWQFPTVSQEQAGNGHAFHVPCTLLCLYDTSYQQPKCEDILKDSFHPLVHLFPAAPGLNEAWNPAPGVAPRNRLGSLGFASAGGWSGAGHSAV